jgi:hypothetical protein
MSRAHQPTMGLCFPDQVSVVWVGSGLGSNPGLEAISFQLQYGEFIGCNMVSTMHFTSRKSPHIFQEPETPL